MTGMNMCQGEPYKSLNCDLDLDMENNFCILDKKKLPICLT